MTEMDKLLSLVRHLRETQKAREARPDDAKLRRQAAEAEGRVDADLKARERGPGLFPGEGQP